jgi:hypothetical protein
MDGEGIVHIYECQGMVTGIDEKMSRSKKQIQYNAPST